MADISLTNITKTYANGVTALAELDLHVQDGEFLVLVGPSGCGKSTLLRMIAGLEEISGGELKIGGRLVNQLEPKERDIAMVFQSYALYPHMTVAENIGFPLRLAKMPAVEIERRVADVAQLLELTPYIDRRPANLSGGQRQRVAMGRAIVRKPSVYLLDEPLSNLDAKLRDQTRSQMVDLQARLGVTTVYVTHDQVEAMTMGHRVAVLKDGVLQQCSTPRELYRNPVNKFVAGFIGMPSMNFIKVTASGEMVNMGPHRLDVPPALQNEIVRLEGRTFTLGIRPEHLELSEAGVPLEVTGVEHLGAETILRLVLGDSEGATQIVVRVDGDKRIERGETVRIKLTEKLHFFAADGVRIGPAF
ncbi:sn-glycerol-3-phosphate ABC transporter ATP-binding protein UgpC [Mesorhizobium sp. Z1-4]|uniref:ABC transporter ATP-binding protein n=1 Tax=Mesorhizobium sp. Z1-4 TaxID=2448478 RepID=UPI000FDA13D7|nr:sn-glycerol-3-phosphate ABC transporter ATP-binding protein UgpC [Mesorhizobium sp. Z1-4]